KQGSKPAACGLRPFRVQRPGGGGWPAIPRPPRGSAMAVTFPPPYTPEGAEQAALRDEGYAVLSPAAVAEGCGLSVDAIAGLGVGWDDLPPDDYLRDGGRYRRRRHSCFVVDGVDVRMVPHRAHWQSLDYNALHGGMER